jgi:hypothetical protein
MSIYRKGLDNVFNEVNAEPIRALRESAKPAARATVEAQSSAEAAREQAEKSKRKKGEPLNVPLPRTLAWAADLPPDIQPHELIRSYARIVNHLALGWEDPDATRSHFDELLVGKRANRKGFPKQVETELIALRRYFAALHAEGSERLVPWEHVRKR